MDAKKLIITIAIVTVVGAGVVSAQPERPDQGRNGLIRAAIQAAGEETGLEAQEIVRQMREGMTLAEVVAANGGDVQTVIDQAVAAASERLAQAVENDRITQEQSDEWLSQIETLITEGVNRELPGRPGIREIVRNGAQVVLQSVTAATGLSAAELRPMLREGMTLAEIRDGEWWRCAGSDRGRSFRRDGSDQRGSGEWSADAGARGRNACQSRNLVRKCDE
jgi:hypothetical protein